MAKTVIYLVRHGQTNWNIELRVQHNGKIPLNKTGKKQAETVAKKFKNKKIDAVYSSPVLRARQTAKIIAKGKPIIFDYELRERELGILNGMTRNQINKKFPNLKEEHDREGIDWKPKGGETLRELQTRSENIFNKILKANRGKEIMIMTHGGVSRSIIHWLHGGKPEDVFHTSVLDNAEVMRIAYDGEKFTLTKQK